MERVELTDEEWRERLTPDQYAVLRRQATERPFTGAYTDTEDPGVYRCAGCGAELFRSEAKFHSGSGWPSFVEPSSLDSVEERVDSSHGMTRTEVVCAACGGHLGHVFPDGARPTRQRYQDLNVPRRNLNVRRHPATRDLTHLHRTGPLDQAHQSR